MGLLHSSPQVVLKSTTPDKASVSSSNSPRQSSTRIIPESVQHWFTLSDGRKFSYYTFRSVGGGEGPKQQENQQPHPVLYLHGFPGCGLQGAVCAADVAAAGGELYAPDRPGFGLSDPMQPRASVVESSASSSYKSKQEKEEDVRIDRTVSDLWEFVDHNKWTSFSVIGFSGGGPYALAFLSSYLDRIWRDNQKDDGDADTRQDQRDVSTSTAGHKTSELLAMSVVGGVCCSAGVDDMMVDNQNLVHAVFASKTSFFARVFLRFMFLLQRFFIGVLPYSFLLNKLTPPDVPAVDRETVLADRGAVGSYMIDSVRKALQHADLNSMEQEACALFWTEQPAFHRTLKSQYASSSFDSKSSSSSSSESSCNNNRFPQVALFHGLLDKNVPPSHSRFVQEQLLRNDDEASGSSVLVTYPDMGHISLVVQKSPDYSHFAVSGSMILPPSSNTAAATTITTH